MNFIMVDIEADGPIPGDYSMVSFGAVIVKPDLQRTFYGQLNYQSWFFVQGCGTGYVPKFQAFA